MNNFFDSIIENFANIDLLFKHSRQTPSTNNSINDLIPIFIVGQPRSGSTLLEQMLIGHSDIATAGELPFLAGDIAQGVYQITGKHFPQGCKELTSKQCEVLGQHYLKSIKNIAPSAKFVIDKMPANYQSIGLIKMILPKAKIIHITRDTVDVSWSIFKNFFSSPEPYFCSLTEIGQYHHCYKKVMSFWQQEIPEFIYGINYQDLVSDTEIELKKLLMFIGLDFQAQCLELNTQSRYIGTLSDIQLRKGVSVAKKMAWKPYEPYLKSLFKALL